jgi:hypothetical protein
VHYKEPGQLASSTGTVYPQNFHFTCLTEAVSRSAHQLPVLVTGPAVVAAPTQPLGIFQFLAATKEVFLPLTTSSHLNISRTQFSSASLIDPTLHHSFGTRIQRSWITSIFLDYSYPHIHSVCHLRDEGPHNSSGRGRCRCSSRYGDTYRSERAD